MFLGGYQPEGGIAAPESREYLMSEQGLRRACEEGIILEAVAVRCDLSFRLTVDLHCMNGYIEREDVQFSPTGEPVRDIAVITRVGKAVCFRVTGFFTENGKILSVSLFLQRGVPFTRQKADDSAHREKSCGNAALFCLRRA